jgi:hypothetical protein
MTRSCRVARAPLREHRGDYYDSPVEAVHKLRKIERLPPRIGEPACGRGNIVLPLRAAGHEVFASDLNDRGCPDSTSRIDFLLPGPYPEVDAIVTNPPFSLAEQFVEVALTRAPLVIMLLPLRFLECKRSSGVLDDGTLARVHVFINRLPMMHREGWTGRKATSWMAVCWMVWDRCHSGPATIDRIRWESADAPANAARERPYDGADDFGKSYDECLRAVRERVAAGGKAWVPK